MTDNVFEYNETYSAAARDSSPTLSPSGMTASLDDAKALSVLYVVPYLLFLLFAAGIIFAARIFRFYNAHCHKGRHSLNNNNERDNVDGDEFHQHADTFRTIQSNHFSAHQRDSFDFGESTVVAGHLTKAKTFIFCRQMISTVQTITPTKTKTRQSTILSMMASTPNHHVQYTKTITISILSKVLTTRTLHGFTYRWHDWNQIATSMIFHLPKKKEKR